MLRICGLQAVGGRCSVRVTRTSSRVLEMSPRSYGAVLGITDRVAKPIGAELKLWSESGHGTEVELIVSGRNASGSAHRRERLRLFRNSEV